MLAMGLALSIGGCSHANVSRSAAVPIAKDSVIAQRAGRTLQHVTLRDPRFGEMSFTISLPSSRLRERLPVVFVLGALGTGEHSVGLIPAPGNNAIVGYDWPIDPPLRFSRFLTLRNEALSVPSQTSQILLWVLAQPWADPHRVTVVGFSLGAIVTPAVEQAMISSGIPIRWTVMADGGASISQVVRGDRQISQPWIRSIAAIIAESVLHPLDPELYASHLRGDFLLISSTRDMTISAAASRRLAQLTPAPKRIVQLSGGHVGTVGAKVLLLDAAIKVTRGWLIAQGAINPGAASTPRLKSERLSN